MRNEYDREDANASTKLTYLLIGGGIGAVIALLFAPKSGQELRGDIAARESKRARKPPHTFRSVPVNTTKLDARKRQSTSRRLKKRPVN